MGPRLLTADAGGIEAAADALDSGSVIALPTDTVYGLAAHPAHPEAMAGLFALKRRPAEVAIPLLVAREDQLAEVAGRLGPAGAYLARHHWPGPVTLVVPRAERFGVDLGGPPSARHTVGIRWPDHTLVQALCGQVGPLAVTSANLHGGPPATTAGEVVAAFAEADGLAAVLDGGVCDGVPSTVVECRGSWARCLREGAIPWEVLVTDGAEGEASNRIHWEPFAGRG